MTSESPSKGTVAGTFHIFLLLMIHSLLGCSPALLCDADGDGLCPPDDCDDQNSALGLNCNLAEPSPSPAPMTTQKIFAAQRKEGLGSAIAVAPNYGDAGADGLLIGAYLHLDDSGTNKSVGGAYLIRGPIVEDIHLEALPLDNNDVTLFVGTQDEGSAGWSLTVADITCDGIDDYIIGEPGPIDPGAISNFFGAVYIVPGPLEFSQYALVDAPIVLKADKKGTRFGFSLATIGNVTGDACIDLLVGAPTTDLQEGLTTILGAGAAFLFDGDLFKNVKWVDSNIEILPEQASWQFLGENDLDWTGWDVAGGVDISGDENAIPDMLISALDQGQKTVLKLTQKTPSAISVNAGATHVIFGETLGGEPSPLPSSQPNDMRESLTLMGEGSGDQAGQSIQFAGDFNGDGNNDVIIGAPKNAGKASESGAAYVIFPNTDAGLLTGTHDLGTLTEGQRGYKISAHDAGGHAGWTVAGLGDVNGDGLDDVVISAPHDSTEGEERGGVYVTCIGDPQSNGTIYLNDAPKHFSGEMDYDSIGYSVASKVDLNGDGINDIVFTALTDREAPESFDEFLRWTGEISIVYGVKETWAMGKQ